MGSSLVEIMVYGFVIKKEEVHTTSLLKQVLVGFIFILTKDGMEKEGNQVWFNGIVGNFRKLRRGKWSCVLMTVGVDNKYLDLIINKKFPFGYYTCIEGWGFEKTEHNSTHIEVQDFRFYNLHGSTEHKMEKFFK